ncbi:hypothetical protein [Thermosynechococcus sp.]
MPKTSGETPQLPRLAQNNEGDEKSHAAEASIEKVLGWKVTAEPSC